MKFFLFFLLLVVQLFSREVVNGEVELIEFAKIPASATVKMGNKTIPILNHPINKSRKFILVPIEYKDDFKDKNITIEYKSGKKEILLHVNRGDYKSEKIHVASSKVTPSKEQKARTAKEYKEAMKIYHTFTHRRYWNKPFILPLDSKITSAFGTARMFNNQLKSFHSGTDFRAPMGTPIRASNDGVVVIAQNRYYAGNSVVIDHGEGVYSCYYHLSKLNVKVGEAVNQGKILGLSGKSGRVNGPHLHYAFMVQGTQVNPLAFHKSINALFSK